MGEVGKEEKFMLHGSDTRRKRQGDSKVSFLLKQHMEQTQVTALGGHISGYILSKKRFFTKINMLIFYVLQYDKKQC